MAVGIILFNMKRNRIAWNDIRRIVRQANVLKDSAPTYGKKPVDYPNRPKWLKEVEQGKSTNPVKIQFL